MEVVSSKSSNTKSVNKNLLFAPSFVMLTVLLVVYNFLTADGMDSAKTASLLVIFLRLCYNFMYSYSVITMNAGSNYTRLRLPPEPLKLRSLN